MRFVTPRPWMQYILIVAGVYNLIYGGLVMFYPDFFFRNLNLVLPNYIMLWQGIGLTEIMFGAGYLIASHKPFKHWTIIFIGFACKAIVSIGFFYYLSIGALPKSLFFTVIANDLIWLLPFGAILYKVFEHVQSIRELEAYDINPRKLKSLEKFVTNTNETVQKLSDRSPTLLVFLRHFGCTFCKEALKEISQKRHEMEKNGVIIVLVHMVSDEVAAEVTSRYCLGDLPRVSDPDLKMYKAFGLKKGNFFQLFGINVMIRGIQSSTIGGNFLGKFIGNGFQMPGIFLIHKGVVIQTFRHTTAADRPDYIELTRVNIG